MDEITDNEVTRRLTQVRAAAVGCEYIERMLKLRFDKTYVPSGMVVFDYEIREQNSFVDCLHTGLAFCETDTRGEWCVLGQTALMLMRRECGFAQEPVPIECGEKLLYIGTFGSITVYTFRSDKQPPRDEWREFHVGTRTKTARGVITNSPFAIGAPALDEDGDPMEYDEDDAEAVANDEDDMPKQAPAYDPQRSPPMDDDEAEDPVKKPSTWRSVIRHAVS